MDVDWNAELVDQLESHWHHQLRPRLDGLTDDEYFWQPVPGCCWTLSRRGESKAPMSLGTGEFTMDYAGPPRDRDPVTTIAWIHDVRAADLTRPQGAISPPEFAAAPPARLVLHVHKEVIHHGAEICLLRDLIRGSSNPG